VTAEVEALEDLCDRAEAASGHLDGMRVWAGASLTCDRGFASEGRSWPVAHKMWEAQRCISVRVGLDVHARSVVACGIDGETGEVFERRLTPHTARF
jgi:hypothetical protein